MQKITTIVKEQTTFIEETSKIVEIFKVKPTIKERTQQMLSAKETLTDQNTKLLYKIRDKIFIGHKLTPVEQTYIRNYMNNYVENNKELLFETKSWNIKLTQYCQGLKIYYNFSEINNPISEMESIDIEMCKIFFKIIKQLSIESSKFIWLQKNIESIISSNILKQSRKKNYTIFKSNNMLISFNIDTMELRLKDKKIKQEFVKIVDMNTELPI